jgi:hypothetical protein
LSGRYLVNIKQEIQTMNTKLQTEEPECLTVINVIDEIRTNTAKLQPADRESQLAGMMQLCDLLTRTVTKAGLISIPAVILGGIMDLHAKAVEAKKN